MNNWIYFNRNVIFPPVRCFPCKFTWLRSSESPLTETSANVYIHDQTTQISVLNWENKIVYVDGPGGQLPPNKLEAWFLCVTPQYQRRFHGPTSEHAWRAPSAPSTLPSTRTTAQHAPLAPSTRNKPPTTRPPASRAPTPRRRRARATRWRARATLGSRASPAGSVSRALRASSAATRPSIYAKPCQHLQCRAFCGPN